MHNTDTIAIQRDESLAGYLKAYRDLQRQSAKGRGGADQPIRMALLCGFTCFGLIEVLAVKCAKLGIRTEVYVGQYNQFQQELIDPNSKLYEFAADVLFLFLDTRTILGEMFFFPYRPTADDRRRWVENQVAELMGLVHVFESRSRAMVVLHNFEVPAYSPMGIQESKQEYGLIEAVEDLNGRLRSACRHDTRTYVLDYDAFCSEVGKRGLYDVDQYYWGDLRLSPQHLPALCDKYLCYLKAALSLTRKCIVLDLDGTLWGGIIGEDGVGGIKLGPTPEGRPYWEFQKHLLALSERGILLAINSRNNSEDALNAIRDHPHMVLRQQQFAAVQINWADKIANLKALSKELSIGLDSMVFLDDDKLNREMVKTSLPEVLVVDLPENASQYVAALQRLDVFDTLQVTDTDLNRAQFYAARRQRLALAQTTSDIADYLRSLEMTVTIESANGMNIPRIAQLTQKTNQFNMTTRRYMQEEIRLFAESDRHLVTSFALVDKFGDSGIVGAVVVEKGATRWRIDTFLLSCRVIGRCVEHVMLSYILKQAQVAGAPLVVGEFIPTKKNHPAREFFREQGFALSGKEDGSEYWEFRTECPYRAPEYIKVVEG